MNPLTQQSRDNLKAAESMEVFFESAGWMIAAHVRGQRCVVHCEADGFIAPMSFPNLDDAITAAAIMLVADSTSASRQSSAPQSIPDGQPVLEPADVAVLRKLGVAVGQPHAEPQAQTAGSVKGTDPSEVLKDHFERLKAALAPYFDGIEATKAESIEQNKPPYAVQNPEIFGRVDALRKIAASLEHTFATNPLNLSRASQANYAVSVAKYLRTAVDDLAAVLS
jgi:hypothetical protein